MGQEQENGNPPTGVLRSASAASHPIPHRVSPPHPANRSWQSSPALLAALSLLGLAAPPPGPSALRGFCVSPARDPSSLWSLFASVGFFWLHLSLSLISGLSPSPFPVSLFLFLPWPLSPFHWPPVILSCFSGSNLFSISIFLATGSLSVSLEVSLGIFPFL